MDVASHHTSASGKGACRQTGSHAVTGTVETVKPVSTIAVACRVASPAETATAWRAIGALTIRAACRMQACPVARDIAAPATSALPGNARLPALQGLKPAAVSASMCFLTHRTADNAVSHAMVNRVKQASVVRAVCAGNVRTAALGSTAMTSRPAFASRRPRVISDAARCHQAATSQLASRATIAPRLVKGTSAIRPIPAAAVRRFPAASLPATQDPGRSRVPLSEPAKQPVAPPAPPA
jgi:hypothetical protein